MQFMSKCAVFQILLDKIHFYFCDPFLVKMENEHQAPIELEMDSSNW